MRTRAVSIHLWRVGSVRGSYDRRSDARCTEDRGVDHDRVIPHGVDPSSQHANVCAAGCVDAFLDRWVRLCTRSRWAQMEWIGARRRIAGRHIHEDRPTTCHVCPILVSRIRPAVKLQFGHPARIAVIGHDIQPYAVDGYRSCACLVMNGRQKCASRESLGSRMGATSTAPTW